MLFLQTHWLSIVLLIALTIVLLYLYKVGRKDLVKKIILSLVIQAEKALGSKTGELKYAMVIEKLYTVLPTLLRVLITQKEIHNLIESSVKYLKDYLNNDRNLIGYDEENIKVHLDNLNL